MMACRRLFSLSIISIFLALMLTACFRDTSEVIEQQPVASQYESPAPIVQDAPATLVEPAATEAVPAATEAPPTALEQPADDFALSATALIAQLTQPASDRQPLQIGAQGTPVAAEQATAVPLIRATIPPGEDCVHEIRAGETLFQLSLAYGVTVDQISTASAIANPDVVAVGQRIVVPLCGTTGFIPPPTSIPAPAVDPNTLPPTTDQVELELASVEDTRSDLIESAQAALLDNAETDGSNAFSIQSVSAPTPTLTSRGSYRVLAGDTLFLIAVRHGTTIEALAALNNITDIDSVSVGDILQIP